MDALAQLCSDYRPAGGRRGLVSLRDMIEYLHEYFDFVFLRLQDFEAKCYRLHLEKGPFGLLTDDERAEILKWVTEHVRPECERYQLKWGKTRTYSVASLLESSTECKLYPVQMQLRFLREAILSEFAEKRLVYVEDKKIEYVEQDKLFGEAVYDNFELARADIKDAGNCYALDLNTACIMLLMRVAEKGLRVLAREQRVKFPIPLELQEWHNVIVAIEKKVDKFEAWPRCAGKKEVLEFYRGALGSIRALAIIRLTKQGNLCIL